MADNIKTQVVVIGAGPGGYSAAFRAADLGKEVIIVERFDVLGGVCLNVGCIPSKALLHLAQVINEGKDGKAHGIDFGEPKIDTAKMVDYKASVVKKLTGGLAQMAKMRKVKVMTGVAQFKSKNELEVEGKDGKQTIQFEHAIIAAGSEAVKLPFIPEDDRVVTSTGALDLRVNKGKMLTIGGGIIALEMATVYNAIGMDIDVVELMPQIVPPADPDIVKPLMNRISKQYKNIMLETSVTKVDAKKDGLYVTFEGKNAPKEPVKYDFILSAVGRSPNGKKLNAEAAGVTVGDRGFISVDKQMRTNVDNIFAIGDIVGQPMLAHKAVHEAHVAAEVIAGEKTEFVATCIPSVAYTTPELAWVGLTEKEAKEQGIDYGVAKMPWAASGRAISMEAEDGFTKLLVEKETNRVIGGGIVGINAGELIAEVGLAIEMGCDVEDIALTIHAHPTLSETVGIAAEVYLGTATDLPPGKKK